MNRLRGMIVSGCGLQSDNAKKRESDILCLQQPRLDSHFCERTNGVCLTTKVIFLSPGSMVQHCIPYSGIQSCDSCSADKTLAIAHNSLALAAFVPFNSNGSEIEIISHLNVQWCLKSRFRNISLSESSMRGRMQRFPISSKTQAPAFNTRSRNRG